MFTKVFIGGNSTFWEDRGSNSSRAIRGDHSPIRAGPGSKPPAWPAGTRLEIVSWPCGRGSEWHKQLRSLLFSCANLFPPIRLVNLKPPRRLFSGKEAFPANGLIMKNALICLY